MTRIHPSDTALAAYAAGNLDPARRLVIATHVALCEDCAAAVRTFECVGGAMLADLPPTTMKPDAFAAVMARIAQAEVAEAPRPAAAAAAAVGQAVFAPDPDTVHFPAPLKGQRFGEWRRLGGGVEMRPILLEGTSEVRAFLLKAAAGTLMPAHTHVGPEWTCVLKGAFEHEGGRYAAGDFDEADDETEHRPRVTPDMECICLVALQGQLRLRGPLGWLLQPFVRL